MSLFKNMKHLPWPLRWAIVLFLKSLGATLRLRIVDPHGEQTAEGPVRIYALWHNRLAFVPPVIDRRRRHHTAFLASRSRDGGYIADILGTLGMQAIRGSSSRGGATALRHLQQTLDAGISVALTPDGPRGPRYEVQDGLVWLAAKSGLGIVPVVLNTERHWELKSWDRTQIPKPFSRAELIYGDPIHIPADLRKEDLPQQKARVRDAMLAICSGDHDVQMPEGSENS